MKNLLTTEWLKMRKYKAFWWIIAITAITYPGINYMFYHVYLEMVSEKNQSAIFMKAMFGHPFAFPEAWHTVAYFSSVFVVIPSIVVIMFITNEYTFKTHRQNIIDGWSRNDFMTAKLIDVLLVSIFVTIICAIVALAMGLTNTDGLDSMWINFHYIGLFALQTFAQLSVAFLIGFLVRKAFIALGIFIFYYVIVENLATGYFTYKGYSFTNYLPIEVSDRLIPYPAFMAKVTDQSKYQGLLDNVKFHVLYTLILVAIVWFICYRINRKRDL